MTPPSTVSLSLASHTKVAKAAPWWLLKLRCFGTL